MNEISGLPASPRLQPGTGGAGHVQRESLLARTFVRLADTLVEEFDVVDFLHNLSADSVAILGAEAAGVMLADRRGELRLLASSEERMRILELFELQGAQGPCLDAFSTGHTIQATVAEATRRWPMFTPRASSAGFKMMCAVPLKVRKTVIGALNLFRDTPEPFAIAELEIAQAMADVAAIALIQERALREQHLLTEQLETALRSRIIIEQAKGMLAEYLSTTVDDAFQLLLGYSRDRNLKLTAVATGIVDRRISGHELTGRRH
jgi:transcriptional regulator with GAF, ATPase, and Fis domain